MVKRICLFVLFVLGLFRLGAQTTDPVTVPYMPIAEQNIWENPKPLGDFQVLTLPIKRAGNLLLVEATIDSIQGNFILDTGAPYLVLNSTYFRNYKVIEELASVGVTSESANGFRTRVDTVRLGELYYEHVRADVASLSSIENKRGVKILGLLGLNLFKQFEVEIDVREQVLRIYKLNKQGERIIPSSEPADAVVKIRLTREAILVKGSINQKALHFVFDTGAEVNILDNRLSPAVFEGFDVRKRVILQGSVGAEAEVLSGYLDALTINDRSYNGMRTIIANLEVIGKAYEQDIDGILGYELLKKGVFRFNFKRKELFINHYQKK